MTQTPQPKREEDIPQFLSDDEADVLRFTLSTINARQKRDRLARIKFEMDCG